MQDVLVLDQDFEHFVWDETQDVLVRDQDETETLCTLSEMKPIRDISTSWDGLKTETPRRRPHPCSKVLLVNLEKLPYCSSQPSLIQYWSLCVCLCGPGSTTGWLTPSVTVRLRWVQHFHHSRLQCQSSDLSWSSRRSRCRTQHQRRRVMSHCCLLS